MAHFPCGHAPLNVEASKSHPEMKQSQSRIQRFLSWISPNPPPAAQMYGHQEYLARAKTKNLR
jgi:hypothetical protein